MIKGCYNNIDEMPIWNWWQMQKTGDLNFIKRNNSKIKKGVLYNIWLKIHDEYLDTYGRSEDYKRILRLTKKKLLKECEYVLTGNRFCLTEMDIIDADLKQNSNDNSTMNNNETIIYLEQKLGRELNPKKISMRKYFDYIKYFNKK